MNNIVMELMSNNFRAQGYSMTRIESSGECRVVIPYKIIESTIFAIVLVDLEIGTELGIREYQGMLRTFQQSVFNEYVTELKILQVIVTNSMDVARDLPSPIWPYWIIHLEECRLMVYEAEHPFFSEARIIIEDTLRGKDYRKKKVDFPLITVGLIVINILIFVILEILGSTYDVDFMLKHGADRYQETIQQKEYYRLITSCFLHYGYEHLISNMFSLMVIGYYLENAIKKGRYLFVYLLCGVTSSIFSLYWYYFQGENISSVGASGAIFGISGALFALIVMEKERFREIGIVRMFLFLALMLYSGEQNDGINNAAHISGFICGCVIMFALEFIRTRRAQHRKGI